MSDETTTAQADLGPREGTRRTFFAQAIGAAAMTGGALAAVRAAAQTATPTPTPTPTATATAGASSDYLNVALNVLYLKANFYSFVVNGSAVPADRQTGVTTLGAQGSATGGAKLAFTDAVLARFANEIAADALANLTFLRAYLGTLAVAQPAIDLSPTGAFANAMRNSGAVAAGATFNPYTSQDDFLLAAFFLADWPIGIYKSVGPVSGSVTILEALGGLAGTEAYHSAMIRATIAQNATQIAQSEQISAYRDTLDGAPATAATTGYASDDDQGVSAIGDASNIVPVNANAIAFSRTYDRVLNIVYLNAGTTTSGGFFPAGVNGTFKTSGAAAA